MTLTLDLGTRELDATHLLMVLYNSVKFDSNPFNNKEVMAKTQNGTDERTDVQTFGTYELILCSFNKRLTLK